MVGMKERLMGLCVLTLLCCALSLPALGDGFPQAATVTTGGGTLNLRKEPDIKSRLVARLPNGKEVTVLCGRDGWVLLSYKGFEGWAMAEFVTPDPALVPSLEPGESAPAFSGQVHIRLLPDDFSQILYTAPGAEVQVLARENGWYRVACKDGAGGEHTGYARPAGPMGVGGAASLVAALSADAFVYLLPDESAGAAGSFAAGEAVQISELGTAWCRVESPLAGYVKTALLSLSPDSQKVLAGEQEAEEEPIPAKTPAGETMPEKTPAPPKPPAAATAKPQAGANGPEASPEGQPAIPGDTEASPLPPPTETPLATPAPEPLSRQAALARALAALADRYLLEPGWEGGLTVQVELSGPGAEDSAEPCYQVDLFGADGAHTGRVLLNAYTGETLSVFFHTDTSQ